MGPSIGTEHWAEQSAVWYSRITKHDYAVGLHLTVSGVDDPDVTLVENYSCRSERNYTGCCNPRVDELMKRQSAETDIAARRQIVWQIAKILVADAARPIIMHNRAATCWHPRVKGHVLQMNASNNTRRFENVWLDK